MPKSKPHEFQHVDEIVDRLKTERSRIENWFGRREESLQLIVRLAVGPSTFRAFRNMPKKPSVVFRDWALRQLEDTSVIDEFVAIGSPEDFSSWAQQRSNSFRRIWEKQMASPLPYGPSRKLLNLLFKHLLWWKQLNSRQRAQLIRWLHVPLDSYTLIAIRNCIPECAIPRNATMKFVTHASLYDRIQSVIRTIAHKANVSAIYFDNLAWNLSH